MVSLDLAKAFDTLDHQILLHKLNNYGIRGVTLALFKSYLENRMQCVQIGDQRSKFKIIRTGVPQGSVLGPVLFLLYMNDFPKCLHQVKSTLYADDTNLYITGNNINNLINLMENEMSNASDWMKVNKLSLNIEKTGFVIYHSKNKDVSQYESLKLGTKEIQRVSVIKFLGISLDEKLNWKVQILHVIKKIAPFVGIFAKIRAHLNLNMLRQLYYSFVYPHLIYCVEVWGLANLTHLLPLYKLQKRILRVLTSSCPMEPSFPLFRMMNVMPLYHIIVYKIGILIYKLTNNIMKIEEIQLQKIRHGYSTRQREEGMFQIPRKQSEFGKRSLAFFGPKMYNQLLKDKINVTTLNQFKIALQIYVNNIDVDNIINIYFTNRLK
jgi:hypothetical protein